MQTDEELEQHLLDSIASMVEGIESDQPEVLLGALMAVANRLTHAVAKATGRTQAEVFADMLEINARGERPANGMLN